jgi:hypothetical protein
MRSLTTHLRRPEDHGRLPFHPDCPMCRGERLAGANPPEALVGHRTQALLAASVLALSSAPPTAAVASEPDREQEGAITPDQVAEAAPLADPQSDPGGSSTELPVEPTPLETHEEVEAAELEQAVSTDDAPADETAMADAPEEVEPAPTEPAPTQPAATPPPPTVPTAETPSPMVAPPEAVATEPVPERAREPERKPRQRTTVAAPRKTVLRLVAPQLPPVDDAGWHSPASVQVAHMPSAAVREPSPAGADRVRAVRRGERVHIVRPNESLWSIARDLLGDEASASRIAREVNRLWELNSDRIGTGDPDLLIAGTRLKVR